MIDPFALDQTFALLVLAGFLAQLVDGALGMGFGIVGTTMMLSLGLPPAQASAMVHIAEVFTTGASGASHVAHRNVDWRIVRSLAFAGAVGGGLGAYVLASVDGDMIKPFVVGYLALMGVVILYKTFRRPKPKPPVPARWLPTLGLSGGFLDAVGGGGWGPIVTSTLIGRGEQPRTVIGSVNLTEFFVTMTISATFIFTIGLDDIRPVLGFIVGGIIAAPLAGLAVRVAPPQVLRTGVGVLVVALSAIQTWRLVAG